MRLCASIQFYMFVFMLVYVQHATVLVFEYLKLCTRAWLRGCLFKKKTRKKQQPLELLCLHLVYMLQLSGLKGFYQIYHDVWLHPEG